MDDGGGAFISWRALSVIKKLGLKPKRTMRSVLWTGEEMGLIGVQAYAKVCTYERAGRHSIPVRIA
jgi:carboxypeptidase Q